MLYKQLLDSDVPEDAYLSKELQIYFPTPLRERFAQRTARRCFGGEFGRGGGAAEPLRRMLRILLSA